MLRWLKSVFSPPEPSGPPETNRRFQTTDSTLTQSGVTALQDAWVVEASGKVWLKDIQLLKTPLSS